MGATKDAAIEEHGEEVTHCLDCGNKLNQEAIDASRDLCFDCYSEHQD